MPSSQNQPRRNRSLPTLWLRCLRLRCPSCGEGTLFTGWFKMRRECDRCGRLHDRAPGFFLGSIYFNYGLTAVGVTVLFVVLRFGAGYSSGAVLPVTVAFTVLFPMWFFRYARALWVAFDESWDPSGK
jgi:uncharacterized protein (DUF983 family)